MSATGVVCYDMQICNLSPHTEMVQFDLVARFVRHVGVLTAIRHCHGSKVRPV